MSQRGPSPITTGLAGRCPGCEARGLDPGGWGGGDGPVAFVVLIVGFVVLGAALVVAVRQDRPVWRHMLVRLPPAAGLCLALMRPLKGIPIALQHRHRGHQFDGSA